MLLRQFVEEKVTCYHDRFDTWEDAIKACGEPLIKQGYIDGRYIDAVIECVHKFGPYIVIAPKVAIPHSTEGAPGVNKTTIGFMRVKEPVHFEEGNPEKDAQLFFILASVNNDEHLANLSSLCELLVDDETTDAIIACNNDEDLLALADKLENK